MPSRKTFVSNLGNVAAGIRPCKNPIMWHYKTKFLNDVINDNYYLT